MTEINQNNIPKPTPRPSLPTPPSNKPGGNKKRYKKYKREQNSTPQRDNSQKATNEANTPRSDWNVRGQDGQMIKIRARTEIEAVKIYTDTYGSIPFSAKREFVLAEHLTDRPFRNNEALQALKSELQNESE